jgi:hypothetical protein
VNDPLPYFHQLFSRKDLIKKIKRGKTPLHSLSLPKEEETRRGTNTREAGSDHAELRHAHDVDVGQVELIIAAVIDNAGVANVADASDDW